MCFNSLCQQVHFRIPYWVFEHLTPERLVYDPSVDRTKCNFREDSSVHQYYRSLNSDYKVRPRASTAFNTPKIEAFHLKKEKYSKFWMKDWQLNFRLNFKGSGYDRGHIAAAGNHRKSQRSVDQTFLLTNMAPQVNFLTITLIDF